MIRLGARLALAGGRQAIGRLALIAVAVAIGVGLLATTLASMNAVNNQNDRFAWLLSGFAAQQGDPSADSLWWRIDGDYFHGDLIGRVDVAATGPDAPRLPGIGNAPKPGEHYASPALAELIKGTPAAELADRYPGKLAGEIGPAALPSPDTLLVVIGHTPDELSQSGDAAQVFAISTTSPAECSHGCPMAIGVNGNGITLVMAVVAVTVLFPVLIFIGAATRLSAARREQRFAAMRLIGAEPRQIATIATVESGIASVAGVAIGLLLFYALRSPVADIPFMGDRFYVDDLTLTGVDLVGIIVGIPVAAAIAARFALRRVTISPLGVARRARSGAPRSWRAIPLIVGVAALGYFAYFSDIGASKDTTYQAAVYTVTIILIMTGLVVAGPWLTMLGARTMVRRARRPATLIAGRRLADDPKSGFRAISGVIVALFVGSLIVGVISTITANNYAGDNAAAQDTQTLVLKFATDDPARQVTDVPAELVQQIGDLPGHNGIAMLRYDPGDPHGPLFAPCGEIDAVVGFGRCQAKAGTAQVSPDLGGAVIESSSPMADTVWPTSELTAAQLQSMPISILVVGADSSSALEQARTLLELEYGDRAAFGPQTLSEFKTRAAKQLEDFHRLANVALIMSIPIAGCSLAVSVAAGLADRSRPFSLLRLTGTSIAVLRRIVAAETVVPLLVSAVVAAGIGWLTALLFLRAQTDLPIEAPSAAYYLVVVAGLIAALGVLASTMPMLRRMTGPGVARND